LTPEVESQRLKAEAGLPDYEVYVMSVWEIKFFNYVNYLIFKINRLNNKLLPLSFEEEERRIVKKKAYFEIMCNLLDCI